MKSSTQFVYLGMLLAAMFAVCFCRPGWRPQGRFGKRLSSSLPDAQTQLGVSAGPVLDVPVEFLFAKEELQNAATKPRLCSLTGLRDYPACNLQLSGNEADDRELLRFFFQRR